MIKSNNTGPKVQNRIENPKIEAIEILNEKWKLTKKDALRKFFAIEELGQSEQG